MLARHLQMGKSGVVEDNFYGEFSSHGIPNDCNKTKLVNNDCLKRHHVSQKVPKAITTERSSMLTGCPAFLPMNLDKLLLVKINLSVKSLRDKLISEPNLEEHYFCSQFDFLLVTYIPDLEPDYTKFSKYTKHSFSS